MARKRSKEQHPEKILVTAKHKVRKITKELTKAGGNAVDKLKERLEHWKSKLTKS